MKDYLSFYFPKQHKFVIVEKINNPSKDLSLWWILIIDYNFKQCTFEVEPNLFNKIKKWLKLPYKNIIYTSDCKLHGDCRGNYYEVYFDMWNVELFKNGQRIFDKRRFENEEFLKLID